MHSIKEKHRIKNGKADRKTKKTKEKKKERGWREAEQKIIKERELMGMKGKGRLSNCLKVCHQNSPFCPSAAWFPSFVYDDYILILGD